ncbi:MAG: DMT family transporter [Methanobacteriota archaeon]
MPAHETGGRTVRADAYLLITAALWGLAFVAQREAMDSVGPFLFNGVRFALGALALLPLILWFRSRDAARPVNGAPADRSALVKGGLLAGCILFIAASLQQAGLVYTGAANAGFITGLYVVLVPVFGIALGRRTGTGTWLGVLLVLAGLYLLSVGDDFSMSKGDLLVLLGAVFWALHVLVIGRLSPGLDPFKLAASQFAVCGALSIGAALAVEELSASGLTGAWLPILYGGFVSVGIAYTLQVVAQRDAHPSHAAIILSLEAAFAALGGWLLLGEGLGTRGLAGCALMLAGMVASQLWVVRKGGDGQSAGGAGAQE